MRKLLTLWMARGRPPVSARLSWLGTRLMLVLLAHLPLLAGQATAMISLEGGHFSPSE
jgi:hypothetical protein